MPTRRPVTTPPRPASPLRPGLAGKPGNPAPDSDTVRSWLSVVQAYNLCDTLLARRLAPLGVRTAEHEILANLRRGGGLTQQDLAQRCFTAKSHISTLLNQLEERGWVRREADPADARAKRLYLQPEGQRVAALTAAVQAQLVAQMAAPLTPSALAQVAVSMGRVSEQLQALLDAGD
jgi:DNA-binding MarR family transcriptional regulator